MEKRNAALPLPPPSPSSLRLRSSGFHAPSRTFHSLRPSVPLPPAERRLNVVAYAVSLLPSPLPANPALVDAATGDTVRFPELLSQIRSLSAALLGAGIARGHCVFFLAPTSLDIPPLYLALLSIGAVVSAANPASTSREIAHLLSLSNPRVAFATSATTSKLPAGLDTIILDSSRFRSFLDGDGREAVEEVEQSDVAVVQFSSGTTGMMKAAALSHRNMITIVAAFHSVRNSVAECSGGRPEATLLGAPLFHSMGFACLLKGLALGETMVLIGGLGRAGVKEIVQAAERYRVTSLTVASPVVVEMARWPEPLELVALEYVTCGGAPLPEAAAVRFMKRFPRVELRQGCGSTEAGPISVMIGQEECRRLRSVGRLGPNVEAILVHTTTGERLSVGQTGELWLRSPYIMLGYVGNEEANDATFDSSGWLKTGDLCYFDEDGFLFIVDRLKELIKCGASQVPPAELEHLLLLLPGIADAAVFPYPDEEAGQVPMAFVVLQPGSNLSEEEIMDFIAEQVIAYKRIRKVAFIDCIPKTPYGKIWRAELRKHPVFSCMHV